jgi:formate dehydrogenase (NADP+) beta subunit
MYKVQFFNLESIGDYIGCQSGCPIDTKAWKYISLIKEEKYNEAFDVAIEPNPFASVCGRICTHPCETACRRRNFDESVSIRAMKRVAEEYSEKDHDLPSTNFPLKEKIAVIGGGPSGLTAALYLKQMGYKVTVFESTSMLGGMLWLCIPRYRLPADVISKDIEYILSSGIEVKLNTPLNEKYTLKDLEKEGYDAIYVAVGTQKASELNIEGNDFDGVLNGIDFLLNINMGYKVDVGKKVVVIGGGDVAMDVARSVVRHPSLEEDFGKEKEGSFQAAVDSAMVALRLGAETHILYRRSREEMPASDEEIEQAEQEGINIKLLTNPVRIIGDNKGKVKAIECIKMKLGDLDDSGRRRPIPVNGSEFIIDCDSVILALGQTPDLKFIDDSNNLELRGDGTILVDDETLQTSSPNIYAGGDVAFGPRNIVLAIANGTNAAKNIHGYLSKNRNEMIESNLKKIVGIKRIENFEYFDNYHRLERQKIPTIPVDRRIGITEVEKCYSKEQAMSEAKSCLRCNIFTVFDSNKCFLCGGCVDICPSSCLKIVRWNEIDSNNELQKNITTTKEKNHTNKSVIIKNQEMCIQCGLCYKRCPIGAITMERLEISEEK